ncbi:hypothetical protein Bbelb_140440 [Branchiostoma belcheri]|nr:hypothetical protein Bbelb_140440 [Branchiostoma belcheri]
MLPCLIVAWSCHWDLSISYPVYLPTFLEDLPVFLFIFRRICQHSCVPVYIPGGCTCVPEGPATYLQDKRTSDFECELAFKNGEKRHADPKSRVKWSEERTASVCAPDRPGQAEGTRLDRFLETQKIWRNPTFPTATTIKLFNVTCVSVFLMPVEEPLRSYALYVPPHGRRRPGRQRMSYLTYIQNMLGDTEGDLSPDNIAALAADRGRGMDL